VVTFGNRVLPDQLLLRHQRPEVTADGAHVAVGQLEPGLGERIGEFVRVFQEVPGDLFVLGVEAQRQVRSQHGRLALFVRVEGVRHDFRRVLGFPLVRASRALGQLPLEVEEVLEEVVGPLRRRLAPDDFQPRGDRIGADSALVAAAPAQALILDHRAFRLRPHQRRVARAVGLAEGVTTGDQRHGFVIVHGHPREGLADVDGRRLGVRLAVRAFRIHVDQAHLHGTQARVQLPLAAVALIAQPGAFRSPEQLFRLPGVGTATAETEGLEAHGLQRHVAGEHEQVGPGQLASVFLLDRPQQAPGLVQRSVVRPAVERRETLLTATGTAAAIGDAIGAGAVPGHADEQPAVVAEVRRPPVL